MRPRVFPLLVALSLAVALASGCRREAPALTDAAAIAGRMAERAAEDFAGIRDFAVVGGDAVLYFRRSATATDSLPAFDLRVAPLVAGRPMRELPSYFYPVTMARVARGLRNGARLVGQDTLAGRRVYILEAPDPASLVDLPPLPTAEGSASARAFVDAETFRLVGLTAAVTPVLDSTAGPARPVSETHRYSDFQSTDGVTLPFRARTTLEGLDQLIPQEMRMVAGGSLAMERAQATRLPPAEREAALADVARRERLIRTGIQVTPFAVREVRVNAGVPDSLFAPAPVLGPPLAPGGPPAAP